MATRFTYKAPAQIRNPKKKAWLAAYGATLGGIMTSCRKADIHHSTYYEWKKTDEDFAVACKEVEELLGEWLQQTIIERATLGKRPSDTLLIFEAKGRWPDKYRERHEITMTRQEREARIEELLARRSSTVSPITAEGSTNGQHTE